MFPTTFPARRGKSSPAWRGDARMRILLFGPSVEGIAVVPFAAACTPGECSRLIKEVGGPALVLVTFPGEAGEEFACRSASLYRDKRFFLVTRSASLEQWARLEAAGVTPLAPEDVDPVVESAVTFRKREPVELDAARGVENEVLQEELKRNPVRPLLLPVTAVTGLRGGCGKTSLIAALAAGFVGAVPGVPVSVCTDDRITVPGGVKVLPAGTSPAVLRGTGLALAERSLSPSLAEEFDRVLVVSRADGVSLGRLAALDRGFPPGKFALVFNAADKVALGDDALPFPCAAVVPGMGSRGFDAGVLRVLKYLCGDDYVFTEKPKRGLFAGLLSKRRVS